MPPWKASLSNQYACFWEKINSHPTRVTAYDSGHTGSLPTKASTVQKNLFEEFNFVDWEMVHHTLHKVPRMFQIWAMKQVMNIAQANGNYPFKRNSTPDVPVACKKKNMCPHPILQSCRQSRSTFSINCAYGQLDDRSGYRPDLERLYNRIRIK